MCIVIKDPIYTSICCKRVGLMKPHKNTAHKNKKKLGSCSVTVCVTRVACFPWGKQPKCSVHCNGIRKLKKNKKIFKYHLNIRVKAPESQTNPFDHFDNKHWCLFSEKFGRFRPKVEIQFAILSAKHITSSGNSRKQICFSFTKPIKSGCSQF